MWFVNAKVSFLKNIFQVLLGQKTWVGYLPIPNSLKHLPPLKPAVLSPRDGLPMIISNETTLHRLNFLYAKDYTASRDLEVIWGGWRKLGDLFDGE